MERGRGRKGNTGVKTEKGHMKKMKGGIVTKDKKRSYIERRWTMKLNKRKKSCNRTDDTEKKKKRQRYKKNSGSNPPFPYLTHTLTHASCWAHIADL
jgi:hypothetical protein